MNHFRSSEKITEISETGENSLLPLPGDTRTSDGQPFWHLAAGELPVPMTNDYLFRALLQKNNKVLKGLISALLHLAPSEISSAVITNPIELGTAIDQKTFILDIRISLNDNTILSLEMQVINEHNWTDRSLSYLCRSFDQLKAGEQYQAVRPVIQVGILNFTLFPEKPEFYSTFQFQNVKNNTLYSDKLRISVLDLTHIELATEEDKLYQIDHWARLFKADTWEEIVMLAQKDEYISEATDTIYQLTQDEKIRMQCEAREDYYRTQRGWQSMLEERNAMLEERNGIIQKQKETIVVQDNTIAEQKAALEAADMELTRLLAWAKEHGYEE